MDLLVLWALPVILLKTNQNLSRNNLFDKFPLRFRFAFRYYSIRHILVGYKSGDWAGQTKLRTL